MRTGGPEDYNLAYRVPKELGIYQQISSGATQGDVEMVKTILVRVWQAISLVLAVISLVRVFGCMQVFALVCPQRARARARAHTHTHTHTGVEGLKIEGGLRQGRVEQQRTQMTAKFEKKAKAEQDYYQKHKAYVQEA